MYFCWKLKTWINFCTTILVYQNRKKKKKKKLLKHFWWKKTYPLMCIVLFAIWLVRTICGLLFFGTTPLPANATSRLARKLFEALPLSPVRMISQNTCKRKLLPSIFLLTLMWLSMITTCQITFFKVWKVISAWFIFIFQSSQDNSDYHCLIAYNEV